MKAADSSLCYRWQCHYLNRWCEKYFDSLTGFPVCGTKLLCVTDSIVFFIEYNTLKNWPSLSFASSFIMIQSKVKFTILVRRKHIVTHVLSLLKLLAGVTFCCYTLSLSCGSACSFLSLVLLSLNRISRWSLCTYICKAPQASEDTDYLASVGLKNRRLYAAFKLTVLQ